MSIVFVAPLFRSSLCPDAMSAPGGIASAVMGTAVLGYDHYSYTTTEKVLHIGPVTATAEQTHTVALPPIIGWLPNYIVAAYLIIFGLLGLFGDIHLT